MSKFENQNQKSLSVKEWLITLLIVAIPVVGLVMLFVYAFENNSNLNRQNWAKAQLVVIAIVVGFVVLGLIAYSLASIM